MFGKESNLTNSAWGERWHSWEREQHVPRHGGGENVLVTFIWSHSRVTWNEAQLKAPLCTLSLSALWEDARRGGFRFQGLSLPSLLLDYSLPEVWKVLPSKSPVPGIGPGVDAKGIQRNINQFTLVAQHLAGIWTTCPGCALISKLNDTELQGSGKNKHSLSLRPFFKTTPSW